MLEELPHTKARLHAFAGRHYYCHWTTELCLSKRVQGDSRRTKLKHGKSKNSDQCCTHYCQRATHVPQSRPGRLKYPAKCRDTVDRGRGICLEMMQPCGTVREHHFKSDILWKRRCASTTSTSCTCSRVECGPVSSRHLHNRKELKNHANDEMIVKPCQSINSNYLPPLLFSCVRFQNASSVRETEMCRSCAVIGAAITLLMAPGQQPLSILGQCE